MIYDTENMTDHTDDLPFDDGFSITYDWIDEEFELDIVREIDAMGCVGRWNEKLSRRTQHYGREYNYSSGSADTSAPGIDTVPEIEHVGKELLKLGVFNEMPNQVLVNEYYRNQGISAHTDSKVFGPVIVSVSLNDDCVMRVSHPKKCPKGVLIFLPRRSLLIMEGNARWEWKHEIPKNVTYTVNGVRYKKPQNYRRLSLTFRIVK